MWVKPRESAWHRPVTSVALAATLAVIWLLTHEYKGLAYDGQIYAVQALARLRPALNSDLFLQNTSQDRFTLFPRLYAEVISLIGLEQAALLLTVVFTVGFLGAAWKLSARLFDRDIAWLTSFLLVISGGNYGAYGVFHFLEPFLTARLAAEALIMTALSSYLGGFELLGWLLAVGALFVHPLIALPGLLLLLCLRLPVGARWTVMSCGVLGCLGIAVAACRTTLVASVLPIMDAPWLHIVEERSQFLFLQFWAVQDWELNLRPFVCLTLTSLAFPKSRTATLAQCAMIVGAAGLAVAGVASLIGPVALLVQGQAWRWVWITDVVSLLLLLPTARQLWSADAWGPLCALLLLAGWLFPAVIGLIYAGVALGLWMSRHGISLHWQFRHWPLRHWMSRYGAAQREASRHAAWPREVAPNEASRRAAAPREASPRVWPRSPLVRGAYAAAIISMLAYAVFETREAIATVAHLPASAHFTVASAKAVMGLRIWCALIAAIAWYAIRKSPSVARPIFIASALGSLSALLFYDALSHAKSFASASQVTEFADWRRVIPPAAAVFVTNGHDSGSFVWFTLERNNYLSPGQSAGVVFSRATALEVRRRSEVVLPLVDANWKMMSALAKRTSTFSATPAHRSLSAVSLVAVCRDPGLDFVISPDAVGFDPVPHLHAGAYENWNLYDCHRVRTLAIPAALAIPTTQTVPSTPAIPEPRAVPSTLALAATSAFPTTRALPAPPALTTTPILCANLASAATPARSNPALAA